MFICLNCGELFEEPISWYERHGLDTPPYEELSGCPYCKMEYAETYRCDVCGESITGDYIKLENGERICSECYTPMELGEED